MIAMTGMILAMLLGQSEEDRAEPAELRAAGTRAWAAGQLEEAVKLLGRASAREAQLGMDLQLEYRGWHQTLRAEVASGAFEAARARLDQLQQRRRQRLDAKHWAVRELDLARDMVKAVEDADQAKRNLIHAAGRADASLRVAIMQDQSDRDSQASAMRNAAEAAWGKQHVEYAFAAYNWALMAKSASLDERRETAADCATFFAKTLGADHLMYARTLDLQAEMAEQAGAFSEATRFARSAVNAFDMALGPSSAASIAGRRRLASLLQESNPVEAIGVLESALVATPSESAVAADVLQQVAGILSLRGLLQRDASAHGRALDYLEKACAIRKQIDGPISVSYGYAISQLANGQANASRVAEAIANFDRAVAILQPQRGRAAGQWLYTLRGQGMAFSLAGRKQDARRAWNVVVELERASYGEKSPQRLATLSSLAGIMLDQQDWPAAIRALQEILQIAESHPSRAPDAARTLVQLARATSMNDPLSGDRLYRQAIERYVKVFGPSDPRTVRLRLTYASVLLDRGNGTEAETLAQQVAKATDIDPETTGEALTLLAECARARLDIHSTKGLHTQALDHFGRAWGLTDQRYLAQKHHAASVLIAIGDLALAEKWLREIISAHEATGRTNRLSAARARVSFALVCGDGRGEYAEAARQLSSAVAVLEKQTNSEETAHTVALLAAAQRKTATRDITLATFARAMAMYRQLQRPSTFFRDDLYVYALVLKQFGQLPEATNALDESMAIYETLLRDSMVASEREQLGLVATHRARLDEILGFSGFEADKVYRWIWKHKGSVVARQGQLARLRRQPELAERVSLWQDATQRLMTAAMQKTPLQDDEQIRQLAEIRAQHERLLAERSRDFDSGKQIGVEKLQSSLPSSAALIDFWQYRRNTKFLGVESTTTELVAFIVRPQRPVVRVYLGTVDRFETLLAQWAPGNFTAYNQARQDAARSLHRILWAPMEPHLDGAKTVLLATEGVTTTVPFAALPGKSGGYLMEERLLCMAPVPQLLATSHGNTSAARQTPLLVGDVAFGELPGGTPGIWRELPGSRREVDDISGLWNKTHSGAPVRLLGATATESVVRKEAPNHSWIHLATHGYALNKPTLGRLKEMGNRLAALGAFEHEAFVMIPGLGTGVVLAGANLTSTSSDDGWLTAPELATLDLTAARLVTVSACESARGRAATGEGALGVQRALHAAGAHATVTSLWPVEDAATAALMSLLYQRLWAAEGKDSPAEALRYAQQTLLRGFDARTGLLAVRGPAGEVSLAAPTGILPPTFWAGFVCSIGRIDEHRQE